MNRTVSCLVAPLPALAFAQGKPDVVAAQAEIFTRVAAVTDRYAQKLGLDNDVVSYCQIELNNKTNQFPKDGLLPFGVNYNNITSAQELSRVVAARESYEKTYMLLCLSRAKRDLSSN